MKITKHHWAFCVKKGGDQQKERANEVVWKNSLITWSRRCVFAAIRL